MAYTEVHKLKEQRIFVAPFCILEMKKTDQRGAIIYVK